MRSIRWIRWQRWLGIIVGMTLLWSVTVMANNGYTVPSWTIDNGGGAGTGGRFALISTIGQHDAGSALQGGKYSLQGGFLSDGASAPSAAQPIMFLPLVIKSN